MFNEIIHIIRMLNMRKIFVLIILLFLIAATNAHASFTSEAGMISYQINVSDRIAVGNVTNIQEYPEYSIVTIKVNEWLMGPLPTDEIEVIIEIGSTYDNSNEARFYDGESVILMLQDINVTESRFKVTIGEPGKHPITDREEIISELGSMVESNKREIVSTTESNNTIPFIGSFGLVLVFACAGFLLRKSQIESITSGSLSLF